jgi:hypothetical protein
VLGLAGGTGSGSFIDAITIARDTYPNSTRYRIIVYALLPETHPNPNWDTGNYHANGYAALLELNALSVGRFAPDDLLGIKGKLKTNDVPFNACYLFTNENDNGYIVNVNEQIPSIVADFLYQKMVATRTVAWDELRRMENAENGNNTPESNPSGNLSERSKRFMAFGIKRLAVPEQEISEYLTYNFARQAALQMHWNAWSDASGFLDEERNQDFHEYVGQKETQFNWLISDEHLSLSIGILPDDAANKKWASIENTWQTSMPHLKSVARAQPQESWLDELSKYCQKRFDQDYRSVGVKNFYSSKLRSKREHVREIRQRIESDLFNSWKNGARSAHDISQILKVLLESIEERRRQLGDRLSYFRDRETGAAAKVTEINNKWSQMGFVQRKMLRRPDSLLDAMGEALRNLYVSRTRMEASVFAMRLIEELVHELMDLKGQVDQCKSTIAQASEKYNDRIAERVPSDRRADPREQMVRFYDPEVVRNVNACLVKDKDEQRKHASNVRQVLCAALGEHQTFTKFNERIRVAEFLTTSTKSRSKAWRLLTTATIQL